MTDRRNSHQIMQSQTTLLLAILLLLQTKCNGLTQPTDSLSSFLELLAIVQSTCSEIDWCTIHKPPEPHNSSDLPAACCATCSCDQECMHLNTCCPDFRLRHILGGKVYQNVSHLASDLTPRKFNNFSDIEVTYTRQLSSNKNILMECTRSQLLEVHRHRPKGSSYYMVTTCSNVDVSVDLKHKCEAQTFPFPGVKIADFIPVQSLLTGTVFRNIHCFKCNTENRLNILNEHVEWELYIASLSIPYEVFNNQVSSIDEIFDYFELLSDEKYSIDIFFEPSNYLRGIHPPSVCTIIDINTCQLDTVTNASLGLASACQKYTMPVFAELQGQLTIFNNLACLFCNGISPEDIFDVCSPFYRWRKMTPFIGRLQYRTSDDSVGQDNWLATSAKGLSAFVSLQCERGYIYDPDKKICRRVFCPCGMIEMNTKCVPIFIEFIGKPLDVYIYITTRERTGDKLAQQAFEEELFNYFEKEFLKSNIDALYIGLWKADSKYKVEEKYLAYLLFKGRYAGVLFLDLVVFVRNAFRGQKTIEANNTTFLVDMYVTDEFDIQKYAVNIMTNEIYHPVKSTVMPKKIKTLTINECFFCFRVEIHLDEMKYSRGAALIHRSQEILPRKGLQPMLLNKTRKVACAAKVVGEFGTIEDLSVNIHANKIEKPRDYNQDRKKSFREKISIVTNSQKENAFLYAFSGFVMIIGLVLLIRRKCYPDQVIDNQVTHQVEMTEVSGH